MQIATDYAQWYDGFFNDEPPLFSRRAFERGGLSKRAQFDLFTRLNLRTPPQGPVAGLGAAMKEDFDGVVASLSGRKPGAEDVSVSPSPPGHSRKREATRDLRPAMGELKCVVYLDEYAHRGEGKVLLPLAEAVERYPGHWGSLWISSPGPPVVYRFARFGRWGFWLRQEGQVGEWRSNRGDSERFLAKVRCEGPAPIPRVLWAIDFIPTPTGLRAVDFNTAPQLETLGEAQALSIDEVADELTAVARTCPEHLRQFP